MNYEEIVTAMVEKYNALSYCEKFAVYDTDLRAYALFHIEHEEDADTLKFDGLQIYINEDEYYLKQKLFYF